MIFLGGGEGFIKKKRGKLKQIYLQGDGKKNSLRWFLGITRALPSIFLAQHGCGLAWPVSFSRCHLLFSLVSHSFSCIPSKVSTAHQLSVLPLVILPSEQSFWWKTWDDGRLQGVPPYLEPLLHFRTSPVAVEHDKVSERASRAQVSVSNFLCSRTEFCSLWYYLQQWARTLRNEPFFNSSSFRPFRVLITLH